MPDRVDAILMVVMGAVPLVTALVLLVWSFIGPRGRRRRQTPWFSVAALAAIGSCLVLDGAGRLVYLLHGDHGANTSRILRGFAFLPLALSMLGFQMRARRQNLARLVGAIVLVGMAILQVILAMSGRATQETSRALFWAEIIGSWFVLGMPRPLPSLSSRTREADSDCGPSRGRRG